MNKKRILILAVVGVLIISLPVIIFLINQRQDTRSGATASQVSFSLFEESKSVTPNSEIELEVRINPSGVTVNAFDFTLKYPKDQLQYVSFTKGTGISQAGMQTNQQEGNFGLFSFEGYPSSTTNLITSQKTVGKIKFKVLSATNGTVIPVTFKQATAANSSGGTVSTYSVGTTQGSYTVSNGQGGGGNNTTKIDFFFDPQVSSTFPGSQVTAVIKATTNGKPLSSFDIQLQYPGDKLQTSEDAIQVRDNLAVGNVTVSNNKIQIIGASGTPLNGTSLTLATIRFTVLQNASGNFNIKPTIAIDPASTITVGQMDFSIQAQNQCTNASGRPNDCTCNQPSQCQSGFCSSSNKCANPQATFTPIPTDRPVNTQLKFSVSLPGIGKANTDDNKTPIRPTRQATVSVYKLPNELVATDTTTAEYNPATGFYTGSAALPDSIANGNYIVKVKLDNTLVKQVPGTIAITANSQNNQAPNVLLINGDLVENNELTLSDYTKFVACYQKLTSCSSSERAKIDLDDDGVINGSVFDIGILKRAFANQNGD